MTKRHVGRDRLFHTPVAGDEAVRRDIALRAYYRYCNRGSVPEFALEDWLVAEREVLAERAHVRTRASEAPGSGDRADRRGKRQPVRL